jgi:hypothetical protein
VRWLAAGAAVWALLSVPIVVGLMFFDDEQVTSRGQAHDVELGRPVAWTTQDASARVDSFPSEVSTNPWEQPTDAAVLPFLGDVALVWTAGVLVLLVGAGSAKRLARDRAAHAPGAASS